MVVVCVSGGGGILRPIRFPPESLPLPTRSRQFIGNSAPVIGSNHKIIKTSTQGRVKHRLILPLYWLLFFYFSMTSTPDFERRTQTQAFHVRIANELPGAGEGGRVIPEVSGGVRNILAGDVSLQKRSRYRRLFRGLTSPCKRCRRQSVAGIILPPSPAAPQFYNSP